MYSPTIEGKVYQVEVVVPDASTEGNVSQVEIVGGGQVKAMFDAQEALLGLIVQYVGETDETYHNGYFYKVVALGTTPETYGWQRVSVQPSGGGAGGVESVNNIDPDDNGNVELGAENIDAEVGGTVDSVQDHLESLRNDLGDLADDVDLKITNPSGGTAGQYLKKTATGEEWADVQGGGSEPTVETITGNTPTIANVQGNHIYNCTGTLTSLTLTAVETTFAEATIYFTAGASITVNIPASVKTIGYTEFSANTSYVVSFANNTMVVGEINA